MPKRRPPKAVEHFDDLPYYEQDSGPNIAYQFVVTPGTLGLMSAGRVRLKGPTTKARDVHAGWDQIYLVLAGSGSVLVGRRQYKVGPSCVVRIPRNTPHGVVLRDGEELDYVYVNAFADQAALDGLIAAAIPAPHQDRSRKPRGPRTRR